MTNDYIKFNWEISFNNELIEMTEYFSLFDLNTVRTLINEETILYRSILATNERNYNQHDLVERYNDKYGNFNRTDFLNLEEKTNSIWLNESDNVSNLSLWDYLMDIKSVARMHRYHGDENFDFKDRIGELADIEMQSRIKLDVTKLDLSLLNYCDWNNNNSEEEESVLTFYKWVSDFINNYPENVVNDTIDDIQPILSRFQDIELNEKLNKIIKIVLEWIETIRNHNILSAEQHKDVISDIREKLSAIPKAMGDFYDEKRGYIKGLNTSYQLDYDKIQIYSMIISNESFERNRQEIFNQMVRGTLLRFNSIPKSNSNYYNEEMNVLKEYLKDTAHLNRHTQIKIKYLEKYTDMDNGCFAIMEEFNGDKFFALSGMKEHSRDISNELKYRKLAALVANNLDVSTGANEHNIRTKTSGYRWAYLTDDTLRHVELTTNLNIPVTYVDPPVKLISDFTSIGDWERFKRELGGNYGCCERKILTHSDSSKDKKFYIRWAPCKRCIPALIRDDSYIETYAYSYGYKIWKEEGEPSKLMRFVPVVQYESIEV